MLAPLLSLSQLTRHAVCLGATGSGKTGLCIGILEDLIAAGVPLLLLDPKGDLASLGLVFPELAPASFAPWCGAADPAAEAARWAAGLAEAGITPEVMRQWKAKVDLQILTPGSDAATPVDVLASITSAPAALVDDDEGLRQYVNGAVAALLGLIGRAADPLTDPASILLATLLLRAFRRGEALPIEQLIPAVVDPPISHIGYFAVDTFLPRAARMELAHALNAMVASPAFASWRGGVRLDVGAWLTPGADGRTPVRVVSLSHLDDAQRMFFVTLLLHAVVGWSRRLPGSSELRALVYFDEVMGYLPPYPRNPPAKAPVLTLMKQARAVGVGVMLATQNPVDIDYKALSNAGTWLVGRLRTRQDRERVVEGIAGAGVASAELERALAALPARSFVVADDRGAQVVRSRHTMSYLRGPITRAELARLVTPWRREEEARDGSLAAPPPLPAGLTPRWLTAEGVDALRAQGVIAAEASDQVGAPIWRPVLYGRLHVRFDEHDAVEERVVHRMVRHDAHGDSLDGAPAAAAVKLLDAWLARRPPAPGRYLPLPGWLSADGAVRRLADAWVAHALREEVGPEEAPFAEREDVSVLGMAVVWLPA